VRITNSVAFSCTLLLISFWVQQSICFAQNPAIEHLPEQNNEQSKQGSQPSLKLFGRIEELVNGKGASLPGQLKKMTPIIDESIGITGGDESKFSGQPVKSFPLEWEGLWKGNVQVIKQENLEICWLSQPAATYRSCQFFKPGSLLSLICRFHRDGGKLELSPPVARATLKHSEDLVETILSDELAGSGGQLRLGAINFGKTIPVSRIESFSFGKRYGPSIGGNFIDSDVLSNQLRELAPGVIEQDIITQGTTHSMYGVAEPATSMGESVVRLTRNGGKLNISLAYVNYQHDGLCINKCVLEGTLERIGD
jgi:hypothetical protein